MSQDIVRVLRIVEYVGPRDRIEEQIRNSIQGQRQYGPPGKEVTIRAATIGDYPEILDMPAEPAEPAEPAK